MNKREHISFKQSWLCEAIHLRESQWGPQDDSKARLLAQHELSPLAKVTCRAQVLSQNIDLHHRNSQLSRLVRLHPDTYFRVVDWREHGSHRTWQWNSAR
jgi:hypothetical protein